MTGFARIEAAGEEGVIVWEVRSVNGRGLDLRLRLPPGLEAMESVLKRRASEKLSRGTVNASLQIKREATEPSCVINTALLEQLTRLSNRLVSDGDATAPSADGLLAIRGVVELSDPDNGKDQAEAAVPVIVEAFDAALCRLIAAREEEGAVLADLLLQRVDEMETLVARAEADPARSPAAIAARLKAQVAALLGTSDSLDESRLHQEAAFLASRADIREELDRLSAHLASARSLISAGGPVGRRLDFLAQEFNRESNTICSKSNAASLTAIGLDLKLIIDQFREQVQNLE